MRVFAAIVLTMFATGVWAMDADEKFADPELRARYETLTKEVRCLVCQNQTIADSSAPLAADLRREIRGMIQAGQSDAEIKTFLIERYGDFVLYRPRFNAWTAWLWLAPVALLLAGLAGFAVTLRRRARLPITTDAPQKGNGH